MNSIGGASRRAKGGEAEGQSGGPGKGIKVISSEKSGGEDERVEIEWSENRASEEAMPVESGKNTLGSEDEVVQAEELIQQTASGKADSQSEAVVSHV